MKNIFITIIVVFIISACSAFDSYRQGSSVFTQQYVPGIEDLPVYTGFSPMDGKNIAYDSESGRIIDASYVGSGVSVEDVRKFYAEVLPQLGWKKNKNLLYEREGDRLKIITSSKKNLTFLKFVIRPAE